MHPVRVDVERRHDGELIVIRLPGGALHARDAAEVAAVAQELSEQRAVRAVLVTAHGPDFCTGAADDLDPLAVGEDPAAALARVRAPVIAAVAGTCRSVGLELVLACDIVVAAADARFALDDVTVGAGQPCWGGTQRLPRAIGNGRAAAMVLLGEALDADGAYRAGLVWEIAADADALATLADGLAAKLRNLGPLALEYAKEAVHRGAELPLRDGLRLEGDLNTLLATSADRAEGLAAFFAKRPADFAGR